jgi:hypothetical protein
MTDQTPAPNGTPGGAPNGGTPPATPWFQSDDFKALPPEAHEWAGKYKTPTEAVVGGYHAARFVGVPADRVLKLPEKPDDPAWGDIRARVGWKAPEKPEDYGIAVPEGFPPEYAQTIAATAHKLGVPKDTLLALAAENDKYVQAAMKAQDEQLRTRLGAADEAMKQALGAKYGEVTELTARALANAGLTPEAVNAAEQALALEGDGSALVAFRKLVTAYAEKTREAPFHDGGAPARAMTPEQAVATKQQKMADPDWRAKAIQRGTPEAVELMRLNAIITGETFDEERAKQLTGGVQRT